MEDIRQTEVLEKTSLTTQVVEQENEIAMLKKDSQQHQRLIEEKNEQIEKMEVDLTVLDNENLKLQKKIEFTTKREQAVEKEILDLKREVSELKKENRSVKTTVDSKEKLIRELTDQYTELQTTNQQLEQRVTQVQSARSRESSQEHADLNNRLLAEQQASTKLRKVGLIYSYNCIVVPLNNKKNTMIEPRYNIIHMYFYHHIYKQTQTVRSQFFGNPPKN